MALGKTVSTGVSDATTGVATSGGAGIPVSSAVKLVVTSSCALDSPEDISGSGLTEGATKTGLDTFSWPNKDKLFASGADVAFSDTETVAEGYEFTSFTIGGSSYKVIFTFSRASYTQIYAH